MEPWRKCWRDGLAPSLSTAGLIALRNALRSDDVRLIQGSTTLPPPLMCTQHESVEGACALGFCGWQGDGLETVKDVEVHFSRCCNDADERLGHPADCRWFLVWFDRVPREEMRAELLPEVELSIAERSRRAVA